ncbi:LOW QUALITY PROTEIN: non-specific ribonucleoside hydrolase RihC [Drosophila ficusphila]|uniref:LOW QUALITY PROTEIN: non-specific ribonucleoside hydrolase RihC n=1 Tax=Drosophila ficusphila TaxID=30025 RepID=UPI0007E8A9B8|nr:LOW QUALITY PROTEIN: non-specific ribonucleoside hydrolase RihC [Drosophila ficusphila]
MADGRTVENGGAGGAGASSSSTKSDSGSPARRYVILDCDGGSDDAWALLTLLHAAESHGIHLLAVTTLGCGNTSRENAARNMQRILVACNRTDIPIYMGAVHPLIHSTEDDKKYFHGRDGFGDCLTDDCGPVESFVRLEHAVTAIHDICRSRPKQITVFAVGPLTLNLALGYTMYGDEFGDNFRDLFIMGGNYQGVGNSTRSAEFNFHSDPEAAHTVLLKTRCPVTILPWEACISENFNIPINWRLKEFAARAKEARHPAITMLNQVEAAQWLPLIEQYGIDTWNPCDALVVAAWLFNERMIRKQSFWHATVDLRGTHTRGQMVLDHLREREKYPENVRIIELVDAEFFKRVCEWIAGLEDGTSLLSNNQ